MIIVAIVVPVAISVLIILAVLRVHVTKRAKKTYDTAAADDGK